jgi:hypothetical protein
MSNVDGIKLEVIKAFQHVGSVSGLSYSSKLLQVVQVSRKYELPFLRMSIK